MYILDTNIISEMMRKDIHPAVVQWLNGQSMASLFTTAITEAELRYGLAVMPEGKRKQNLQQSLEHILDNLEKRILPYDRLSAKKFAEMAVNAKLQGKGFPKPDAWIASIASAHGYSVVTRDEAPFEAVGVAVVNLWTNV